MALQAADQAYTTLSVACAAGDLAITVNDASSFPDISAAGDFTYLTLISAGAREVVKATSITGQVITIVRAQGGYAASAFSVDDRVELRIASTFFDWIETSKGNVNGPSASVSGNVPKFGNTAGDLLEDSGKPIAQISLKNETETRSATIDMAGHEILRPLLRNVEWKNTAGAFAAGTMTLDMALGNVFSVTLTANVTALSIINPPTSGNYGEVTLFITQPNGSTYSFAFGGARWLDDRIPIIEVSNSAVIVRLSTKDAGTTWYGRVLAEELGSGCVSGNDVNTKLLIHSNATQGDTAFNDESAANHTIIKNGGVAHSSSVSAHFGATSIYFDGSDDTLQLPADHADWDFGSGDFTIDMWIRPMAFGGMFISKHRSGDQSFYAFAYDGNINSYFFTSTGAINLISSVLAVDVWTHVAIVKSGTTIKLYQDGVEEASAAFTGSMDYGTAAPVTIGGNGNVTPTQLYTGYIDEIRVSKGVARWTANFTPPVLPYCDDS